MRLLLTGDLHIGRRPSRLPLELAADNSAAHAWLRLVDFAVASQVHAVLLSGDVVDRGNRFFEAIGPLTAGLKTLAEKGIETVAVAGNHDFDTLGRLVDTIKPERFKLLGRDGVWETHTLSRDGDAPLRLIGWSFPSEKVPFSPLRDFPTGGDATLGLLHADVGVPGSVYAPVTESELTNSGVARWLLGHIHRPRQIALPGGGWALYPGSPQGLDPGEEGLHGSWLLDTNSGAITRVAPARLRYDVVPLNVEQIDFEAGDQDAAFQQVVTVTVRDHLARCMRDESQIPQVFVARLCLHGRTHGLQLLKRLADRALEDPALRVGDTEVRLDTIILRDVRPAYDLESISRGHGAPAELARVLTVLQCEKHDETTGKLLADTVREMHVVHDSKGFGSLAAELPSEATTRGLLLQEGFRFLDVLLAQKETE